MDVTRYALGARGIEGQRVLSGAVGGALSQTALGFPVYGTHGNNVGMVSLTATVVPEPRRACPSSYVPGTRPSARAW